MVFISILVCVSVKINAQSDSIKKKINTYDFSYFRIGLDASKFVASSVAKNYDMMEFAIDANYKNNLLLSTEFGFGNSKVENQYLNYKSNNVFIRLGIDKNLFNKEYKGDLDNAYVGVRYALGLINRGEAQYLVYNSFYGNKFGQIASSTFLVHWIELTGGFKMEIKKNVFLGWSIRFKTFLNPKKFEQLPPSFVAGYGTGDRNTVFGYNFYVLYGFGKKH